jgi:protein-S-isoprenylcysteine O-methyltransferase Ste14
MVEFVRWTCLVIWFLWLILYWGAGIGLISNLARSFRSTMFFYDRFFILGLVTLANVILWTGFFILRTDLPDQLPSSSRPLYLTGCLLTLAGASGTFWCRRQMRASWSAHTTLLENHRLVDAGPYGIVRHPIYSFACLMTFGTLMVFPTAWNLLAGIGMVVLYLFKLQFEERMLERELPGYREYRRRVRYRLLPLIW